MNNDKKRMNTNECKAFYEGKHYFSKTGREFYIKQYNSYDNVIIEFLDGGEWCVPINIILNQKVQYPFENSCIAFLDNKRKYENTYFKTNQGYIIKVVEYITRDNIIYEFVYNGYRNSTTMQNILKGQIRNPFHPNKFGGYIGNSIYVDNAKEYEWLYRIWYNLLIRTQDQEYYKKYHESVVAYSEVLLYEPWLNYSIFAQWYMDRLSKLNKNIKYDLDKDILCLFHNIYPKLYSPSTCCLIPHDLNTDIQLRLESDVGLFKGKNILQKSDKIKQVAKYYKDINALDWTLYFLLDN